MMEKSKRRETNLAQLAQFLEDIRIYRLTEETATIYGQIKVALFNQFAPKEKSKRKKNSIKRNWYWRKRSMDSCYSFASFINYRFIR